MSTGFSGNLGFPMPNNWAFDQFYEFDFSKSDEFFRLDKDAYSGLDPGVGSLDLPVDIKYNKDLVIYPETIVFQNPLITIKTKLEAHLNKNISKNKVEDLKTKLNVKIDVDKNEISKINLISFLMNNNFKFKINIDPKSLAVSIISNNVENIIKGSIKGVTITHKTKLNNGINATINSHFGFIDSYVEIVYSKKIDLGNDIDCDLEYTIKITGSNLHIAYAFALCYEYVLKYSLEALIAELQNRQKIPDIIMTNLDVGAIIKNIIEGIGEKIVDCLKKIDENKNVLMTIAAIAAIVLLIFVNLVPAGIAVSTGAVSASIISLLTNLKDLLTNVPLIA